MVAASSRHVHQKNLRGGSSNEDNDVFKDDDPRSILGVAGGRRHPQQHHQTPPSDSLGASSAVLSALSDENSELAQFLLCGSTTSNDGVDDGDENMKSMSSVNAGWYALALEPVEVRNERIIMLFEGYAIFGALFMNAVWIIYEYGNANGDDGNDAALNRAFECIMGIALCCNIFLSIYAAGCWMISIAMDSLNEEFVFECRTMLTGLQNLLMFTSQFTQFGLFLAVYKNLYPNLPEVIVTLSFAIIMYVLGTKYFGRHIATCMSLEFWHFPLFVQFMSAPSSVLNAGSRKRLKDRAKLRAKKLRTRAFNERSRIDPNFQENSAPPQYSNGSLGELLHTAAINLGRVDDDVSIYVARLEKDWFNEVNQLRERSVSCLAHYMPLRLAEEVHKMLGTEGSVAHVPCEEYGR